MLNSTIRHVLVPKIGFGPYCAFVDIITYSAGGWRDQIEIMHKRPFAQHLPKTSEADS